jgi:hypothetical protein
MRGLLALAAALTALGSPGGSDEVYRVSLSATSDGRSSSWVEWVAPADGRWRVERPDETAVFTGRTHALKRDLGVSIRTGSARFLAPVAKQSIALDVVRSYRAGRADEDGIEVGTSPDGTTEHFDHYPGRPPTRVYVTLYAGGLQVSSQDVRSHLARRTIAAFNGRNGDQRYPPWPRSRVRLASTGDRVTVVQDLGEDAGRGRRRFIAITRTTLVAVNQGFVPARIPAVARTLRPVR